MKKILLCSAAVAGVAFAAAPAMAQVDVTVGGYSKNYVGWLDQDETAGTDVRDVDMLRDSELHFNAEGTADNGLTYGFHGELQVDGGDDATTVQESYLYLASSLGRVNLGSEDGANYLLQVAAPSADSNVDGLRQYINPINIGAFGGAGAATALGVLAADGIDYDNDASGLAEKVTYLSPNWAGFQFGASFTPDVDGDDSTSPANANGPAPGFSLQDDDTLGASYEGALRYEGTFNNVGFAVGGGYTYVNGDAGGPLITDDVNEWNLGADFDIGAFGVGAAYTETNSLGGIDDLDVDTVVVGADYTTGPFQFGASYLNKEADSVAEIDRYTGGVVYTVTQGLTLRGSVQYDDVDVDSAIGGGDADATSVLGGVQFNF